MSMDIDQVIEQLYNSCGTTCPKMSDQAHIEFHGNKVLGAHTVPGLEVHSEELAEGIRASIRLRPGIRLEKPVRVCFGILPEHGRQHVILDVDIGDGASAAFEAFCTFPKAVDVLHRMDATLKIGRNAEYRYFEQHVHGPQGGVNVIPKARVEIAEGGRFYTEFALIKGRVGRMDIDYEMDCAAHGVFEMLARISGRGDDEIKIREAGRLLGEYARGALTSHIAVRDRARANIDNVLIAEAPFARGHVDCKEIVQDQAVARAVPIVEVRDPRAHVTHEAAIGSVDSGQLQTLMARGLDEDAAVDLIIQGMLS